MIFVPLVINRQLLARTNLPFRKHPDWVEGLRIGVNLQTECSKIGITRVINESWFVPIKRGVDTEWMKVVILGHFFFCGVVHVKEVAWACLIVMLASYISKPLSDDFTNVLSHKCTRWNVLHRSEAPHCPQHLASLIVWWPIGLVDHTGLFHNAKLPFVLLFAPN